MTKAHLKVTALKATATHEFKQLVGIFLYLAFFFCSITTYKILLLKDFHAVYADYTFVLINAFVFAKVILIGEYVHLGKKVDDKPLLVSSIYKALLFSFLVIGSHYLEEALKRLVHGENMAGTLYEMSLDLLLARTLIIFSTFVPFFAFRELRRVFGEEKFEQLFFRSARLAEVGPLARKRELGDDAHIPERQVLQSTKDVRIR